MHGRKVQLPWKRVGCCVAAGQHSGRPLSGRWAWKSAGCGVQSRPGSSRLVAGEAVLGEMLLRIRALVCESGLGALEKVKSCFGKACLFKAFPLLWISMTCSDCPKGRNFSNQMCANQCLPLRLFCSGLLPLPGGPLSGASLLLLFLGCGCRKGTLL